MIFFKDFSEKQLQNSKQSDITSKTQQLLVQAGAARSSQLSSKIKTKQVHQSTSSNSKMQQLRNPMYGQLIVGPPGSGKSTYCERAYKFFKDLGRRICIVNLDPGNENMQYTPEVNVMQLITVEHAMNEQQLGPNGALMHCMKYLQQNVGNWLLPELRKLTANYNYFLFDCPGQIELYTHDNAMAQIFAQLQSEGYHLVTVNLIDSHYCSDPSKFVSTLLVALNSMLRLALPHINVLSKADLLKQNEAKLCFNVDFYTDVLDLKYLLEQFEDTPSLQKHRKLAAAICSIIEDYSLVSFQLLDSNNTHSLLRLRNVIDRTNGYVYRAGEESAVNALLYCAVGAETEAARYENDIAPYLAGNVSKS